MRPIEIETVTVGILGKDYQIRCPPDEKQALLQSATYLNKKMCEIRDGGKVIGLERIAVMAALNMSYELMEAVQTSASSAGANDKLSSLTAKIDDALNACRQLEI